jgi:predicted small secreted protein
MPFVSEVLHNEDGPILLVRGESAAEVLALAADEAACNDMAVTGTEADIRHGGHEVRDGFEWCDGGMRCHYAYGKPGPGAFRGAFVSVRYLSPEELRTTAATAGED